MTRDVINFRADFGILWDVGLHVDLPLVIAEQNTLDFDQSESNCVFPGGGSRPTCVNAAELHHPARRHLAVRRQQLGSQRAQPRGGRSAGDYSGDATSVFRSPKRSGFGYVGVGITWAAFNQQRDDTKPTWTLNFDALLDVFKDKRFDPPTRWATPRWGPATISSSGRRGCRSASATSIPTSAPGTTCRSAPTAARSRSTRRRRPA